MKGNKWKYPIQSFLDRNVLTSPYISTLYIPNCDASLYVEYTKLPPEKISQASYFLSTTEYIATFNFIIVTPQLTKYVFFSQSRCRSLSQQLFRCICRCENFTLLFLYYKIHPYFNCQTCYPVLSDTSKSLTFDSLLSAMLAAQEQDLGEMHDISQLCVAKKLISTTKFFLVFQQYLQIGALHFNVRTVFTCRQCIKQFVICHCSTENSEQTQIENERVNCV